MSKETATFLANLSDEYREDFAACNQKAPWFGHFIIDAEDSRVLEYKVGEQQNLSKRIVNWLHPLAQAYYDSEAGDFYDIDDYQRGNDRLERYAKISGILAKKTITQSKDYQLVKATVQDPSGEHLFVLRDGHFINPDNIAEPLSSVDGLPDIRALLTSEQYRLIKRATKTPLIIQGQAGSGKTTVALYRVRWLIDVSNPEPVNPKNVLVVMFNKSLQKFVESTLEPLGLQQAKVSTFHAWTTAQINLAYKGVISAENVSNDTPGKELASRVKKQAAMLRVLDKYVERQVQKMKLALGKKLAEYGAEDWLVKLEDSNLPIRKALIDLRIEARQARDLSSGLGKERLHKVYEALSSVVKKMSLYKEDLLKVFRTDNDLIKAEIPSLSEEDLMLLASFQLSVQEKVGLRKPSNKVTFEDLALILRLVQIKNGGFPKDSDEGDVNLYDHVVIDEAQDFGGVELRVMLDAVNSKTGLTIVGDVNQKIIPQAEFPGWDVLANALDISGAEVSSLEVAHRSTKPVMDLANFIIAESTKDGRDGSKPTLIQSKSDDEYYQQLYQAILAEYSRKPTQHICVVSRYPSEAKILLAKIKEMLEKNESYQSILPLDKIRQGYSDDFLFSEGVSFSSLRQIKGLEFDTVILCDPSERNFPSDSQGRKSLYTVVTRAKENLHCIGRYPLSDILASAIKYGLIDNFGNEEIETDELSLVDEPF